MRPIACVREVGDGGLTRGICEFIGQLFFLFPRDPARGQAAFTEMENDGVSFPGKFMRFLPPQIKMAQAPVSKVVINIKYSGMK